MPDRPQANDERALREQWRAAFDAAAELVCKINAQIAFELIENRFAHDQESITPEMRRILYASYEEMRRSDLEMNLARIEDMRLLNPARLQSKAEDLGYEAPLPFILSALVNAERPTNFDSNIQKRDNSVNFAIEAMDKVYSLDAYPYPERTLYRYFYSNCVIDHSIKISAFFDASIRAILLGKDFETAIGVARLILVSRSAENNMRTFDYTGSDADMEILGQIEPSSIDSINPPPRKDAVNPAHRAIIEHYVN